MADSQHFKSEPPSAQEDKTARPDYNRGASSETERPPSAQQLHDDSDERDDETEEEIDEDLEDPVEKIADFDWEDLHRRYHEAMNECHQNDAALTQEWEALMNYFRVWAEAGNVHETDRTFKRLQARTEKVQDSEDKLEKTRNHYTNVVKAFESALNLLKANGFGG